MNWTRWIMMGGVAASMWCVPAVARAGGCPACETSEDCPDGFCVFWDPGHGCESVNPICCPGQGCAVGDNGRPSCEADGLCCVVEDPQCAVPPDTSSGTDSATSRDGSTDASGSDGTADAEGSSGATTDASATDASATDASATDSGDGTVGGGDDGTDTAADDDDDGCGCTTAPRTDRLAWLLAAAAGVLTARRRRP